MKSSILASLAIVGLLSLNASAHKLWIRPSQTQFSGTDAWVTIDAAVSNDLFYFNHVPLRLNNVSITGPDGQQMEAANPSTGKYRSVFDVELTQDGSYRIALLNSGLFASWTENGEPKRWRGTTETFAKEVPLDAKELRVMESSGRVETFVTKNAPNATAFQPTGKGIELIPVTHPNDLYVGEKATFRILVEGEPKEGLEVSVIRGETRYRNSLDETQLTTSASGEITVAWPEPGMYWLSTASTDEKTSVPQAQTRRLAYAATFEVLPE